MNFTDDMKTPWFSAGLNPERDGWYEARYTDDCVPVMWFFQTGLWYVDEAAEYDVLFGTGHVGDYEQWRGLKEQA